MLSVRAATYNEAVDGELSANGATPTPFALEAGINVLVATPSSLDFDILRISVPANHRVDALRIEFHEGNNRVFAGLQAGSAWTAGVGFEVDPTPMLGWVDFPVNIGEHTGVDILPDMAAAPGSIGFSPPLGSGNYTMLFQTQNIAVPFALSFAVAPVGAALDADFTSDGKVDGADFNQWRTAFGLTGAADADSDGDSDGRDFLAWQAQRGSMASVGAASAAPEPSAVVLAAVGWSMAEGLRRRRGAGSVRGSQAIVSPPVRAEAGRQIP